MKRAAVVLLGFILLGLPLLHAQSGKKLLTLRDVIHPAGVVGPGITALNWRPGGKQLTFLRPSPKGREAFPRSAPTIWRATPRPSSLIPPAGSRNSTFIPTSGLRAVTRFCSKGKTISWLLDPQTRGLRRLTQDGEAKEVPAFSPAGDRIAFVKKHDLYVVDVKSGAVRRLTHDGSDTIYNGRLDWVYEEELANRSTARAFEWSPDGKRIAYLRLDDGPVPEYPITDYLSTHVSLIHERFPQAGDPNPLPSLHVVAVDEPSAQPAAIGA